MMDGAKDGAPHAGGREWANRRHFFAVASEAMRRILVENARRKGRVKYGGGVKREDLELEGIVAYESPHEILDLNEALERFANHDPAKAKLVELHVFGGLTMEQAADCADISLSTAERGRRYAPAWLYAAISGRGAEKTD